MNALIQFVIDAASVGSLFALLGLGIALIFGIMGLVNFAHAELIMFGGYLLFLTSDLPWPLPWLICIVGVVILALAMERVAFRKIRGADPATGLIASFAVAFLLQNVAILVFGGRPKSVAMPAILQEFVTFDGIRIPFLNLLIIGTTAVILVALWAFLGRTAMGVQMRAAAEDFDVARLLGVRADRVIAVAFALSGVLAAVAAIFLVAQTGTLTPTMGVWPVLIAFAVTIIGGLGSLSGAVLSGFVLGALTVAFQTLLPLEIRPYRDAFVFGGLILLLLLRPRGLIPPRVARV